MKAIKHWHLSPRIVAAGIFVAAAATYVATLAPSVLWGDDARYQLMAYRFDVVADELSHPLYIALAHLFTLLPFGEIAWRVNLASAVFAAAAVCMVYLSGWEITRSPSAALAAAAAVAVSHTFWAFAVRAQAHALNALFVSGLIWGVLRWRGSFKGACLLGLLFGLGTTNHFLLGFTLPALVWFFVVRAPPAPGRLPLYLGSAFCIALGFAPFYILSVWQGNTARSIDAAGYLLGLSSVRTPLKDVAFWSGFLGYNFAGIALALAGLGAIWLWGRQRRMLVGLILLYVINAYFVFDLSLADQYKYYIPSYIAVSILVAPGFHAVTNWVRERKWRATPLGAAIVAALVMCPILVYDSAPRLLHEAGVTSPLGARDLPGRDALVFFLQPSRRGDYGAYEFAHAALTQVELNAVIAGDHTPLTPLIFVQQTELLRPDISIAYLPTHGQIDVLQAFARTRPVYLTDTQSYYEMDRIGQVFEVERRGVLYELFPRRDAALQ